jgi:hypothetical protein
MFAKLKLQFRTEKRSKTNNVPIFFLISEGLEDATNILIENFLEISALTIRARPSGRDLGWAAPKKSLIFSGELKEWGGETDGLRAA